jgi:hypothetical protein
VKKQRERRRREKTQAARLLALGVPQDVVEGMNARQIRQALRHPARIQKRYAS